MPREANNVHAHQTERFDNCSTNCSQQSCVMEKKKENLLFLKYTLLSFLKQCNEGGQVICFNAQTGKKGWTIHATFLARKRYHPPTPMSLGSWNRPW